MTWVRVRLQTRVPSGRASDFFVSTGKDTVNVITSTPYCSKTQVVEFSPVLRFSCLRSYCTPPCMYSTWGIQYTSIYTYL